MIPAGYMLKRVEKRPDWLKQPAVEDIFSVSNCTCEDFCQNWIDEWKHNGYWFFDSPEIIYDIAKKHNVNTDEMTLFYYEAHEILYDAKTRQWESCTKELDYSENVKLPSRKTLQGYDVVTYSRVSSDVGCSPLSCNHLAEKIPTNSHCLLDDLETAKTLLETGAFENSEPGPYRVIAVYTVNKQ